MKKFGQYGCLLVAAALLLQACGDEKKAKNYNDKTLVDQRGLQFILAANEAGLAEIKAAETAQEKSKNQRVIMFAKMMIADHAKAAQELNALAKSQLVTKTDTLSEMHKKSIDSLSKLKDAQFDKAYMTMMVKDHGMVVHLFEQESTNKNNKVQDYANKYLPALKMHLDSANAINSSLK